MIELPEGCIATVISFASPRDACRFSCVNSVFKSAAESDAVWDRFLPPDYRSLIFDSDFCSSASSPSLGCPSKKDLFLSLCHTPILIEEGKMVNSFLVFLGSGVVLGHLMSFQLDKSSGKKCYMISAANLTIVWGDTPTYWRWTSVPGSRFPKVAELIRVCWLEIRGKINTCILSPMTTYGAYLVFKSVNVAFGFVNQPVKVTFGLVGSDSHKRAVYLDLERGQRPPHFRFSRHVRIYNRNRSLEWQGSSVPRENDGHYPEERGDGWLEIELGEIFIGIGEKNELEMSVMEVTGGNWKEGLIVQGIEIRPKQSK
ncbi:hypothetical protein Dsin_001509 [Dipteronia sinensis]|uniref:F-box domain-containing protein n=1 Tax=Dipteronia sinensis TaxID=43782 RepID=A0AAE0EIE3_9ROSI|nr:hypothetical protein Dsin_001509 [Dipteronia sinensis]